MARICELLPLDNFGGGYLIKMAIALAATSCARRPAGRPAASLL